jgi:hypothetical protein
MDAFRDLISALAGEWTAAVLVVTGLVVWAVNKAPDWLSKREGAVRGSPSSAKYWRARLAEAILQRKELSDTDARDQLDARITEARIQVEAHEAKRRLGIGGTASLWVLVAIFGVTAALLFAASISLDEVGLLLISIVLGVLMISVEILALHASSAGAERFGVLVAAGRFGHSDLVRVDPWAVLRAHDYWSAGVDRTERRRGRKAQDKRLSTRWTRFERNLIGVSPWASHIEISEDIWASPVREQTLSLEATANVEVTAADA